MFAFRGSGVQSLRNEVRVSVVMARRLMLDDAPATLSERTIPDDVAVSRTT